MVDLKHTVIEGEGEDAVAQPTKDYPASQLGMVPVMLRSGWCNLKGYTENDFPFHGECPFDQVRL